MNNQQPQVALPELGVKCSNSFNQDISEIQIRKEDDKKPFIQVFETGICSNVYPLPGQVLTTQEECLQCASSSGVFDLEQFRKGNVQKDAGDSVIIRKGKYQEIELKSKMQQELKEIQFLGIKFVLQYLYERNKNPTLLLYCIYFSHLMNTLIYVITFYVGLKFRLLFLFFCIGLTALLFYFYVCICRMPTSNISQLNLKLTVIASGLGIGQVFLLVYGFGFQTPFDSMPIFIVLMFVLHIFIYFEAGLIMLPNSRHRNDPNYQMRYFASRGMIAFFNACGLVDVCSDVALGLELVRYFSGYVFGIGVVLFVLCAVDYMLLVLRTALPKISMKRHVVTIVIELLVIALTVSVIFGVSTDNGNSEETKQESIIIIAISVATTVVNLLHHVFLVYDQCMANSIMHSDLSIMCG